MTQITEIAGMEGDVLTLQDLFVARLPEWAGDGAPLVEPLRDRAPPGFLSKLQANGVELPPSTWLGA